MDFILHGVFATNLITNSSSVVYSAANGPSSLHAVINEVLQVAGINKKSEDLFDIVVIPSNFDRLLDDLDEDFFADHNIDQEWFDALSWKEQEAEALRLFKQGTITMDMTYDNYESYEDSSYLVSTKDGTLTEIGELINRLFTHEATYD